MGNLSVLDEHANPTLLKILNPSVVMIGLNISRGFHEPFRNFHDPCPSANDFKIRHAFHDTEFWGAYMTDVIKGFVEPVSETLIEHLRKNPEVIGDHIQTLRAELLDLGSSRPLILAFGGRAHALIAARLSADEYSRLVHLTHYSYRISKEKYRDVVHGQILRAKLGNP